MGYQTVQISGTCTFEAQWLKEQLDAKGLKCVLTHTRAPRIFGETEQVCNEHKAFGCKHVGLGSYPFDPENDGQDYPRFLKDFLPVAKVMKEHSLYLMCHNHDREFRKLDGQLIMEKLLSNTDRTNSPQHEACCGLFR